MTYKIDRLDDFGRGITSVDGKVCFVSNALVDEEIELAIENNKNKFYEGKTLKILKKSKNRVVTKCPYFDSCGGCNIMHMNYDLQLDFKKQKVLGIITKFTGIKGIVKDIVPSIDFNYRNKVKLKVHNGKLGYYKDKSYSLTSIDECLLCKKVINDTIMLLKNLNLNNIEEVVIRCNYLDEVLLCLKGHNIDRDYFKNNLDIVDNIVIIDDNVKSIIKGQDFIIDKIDDLFFKVSLESFFQVNSFLVKELYNKVLEYANLNGKEKVLDLYCGTGTIGMFLSKKAKKVYGIEINENAINDANYNKNLNNISNINFLCNDVLKIGSNFGNVDLVVIDPPRSGLKEKIVKNIMKIHPKKIVYVSCDPVTLARDLNVFKNLYDVVEITPLDMFPNTYHVECVCLLKLKLDNRNEMNSNEF